MKSHPEAPTDDFLLTPEQVAERVQMSLDKIYAYLRNGELEGVKIGRHWRIRPRQYEAWIDKHQTTK